MRILFVDAVCPKPYDPLVLATEAIGGTEATVVRVADALVGRGAEVIVKQHNRTSPLSTLRSAHYAPFGAESDYKPTHVIVLRAPMALYQARKQFPYAKLYLWCHDIFAGPAWAQGFQALVDTQAVPVVVSDWHKSQMYDAMRQLGCGNMVIPSRRIYNPIDDDLAPNDTKYDVNKLVFFSSPHKGLEHTLKVFEQFQNFDDLKDVKLYIANPGYYPDHKTELKNVVNLGSLKHSEVIDHVRSSLAVLHLNSVFPETFGIVHAESNAVGTPFLSARIGAVHETADHPGELIDVMDAKAVIERIRQWRGGRPKVRANPNFRLSKIVREWQEFLNV
jgi:glycosyltransferase involved in cell wall biosynthesis